MRAEMLETLHSFRDASGSFKDLIPRVGDTGFGRLLIKKKTPEPGSAGGDKPRR